MQKLLEVKNLYKQYKGQSFYSVDNVSFNVYDGEVVGLVGKNGVGKSSILKCVIGLEKSSKGQVLIGGYDIDKDPVKAKSMFGYVPDESMALENMTGIEYINFIADIFGVSLTDRTDRLKDLEKRYSLGAGLSNLISTYSHGMKQKIELIASLMAKPKLWILDEPLTGLDPQTTLELKNHISLYSKNCGAVLMATHNLAIAQEVCSKIIIINNGSVLEEFDISKLQQENKSLEEYFIERCNGV